MTRDDSPGKKSATKRIPFSEEAERGVLGSILLDYERVLDLCNENLMTTESFYLRRHQLIYGAMQELQAKHRPVESLTLSDHLNSQGLLNEVGGVIYLDELIDSTPTELHAKYYVDIVGENYQRRLLIDAGRDAIDRSIDSNEDIRELLGSVEKQVFEISNRQRKSIVPWNRVIHDCVEDIERIFTEKRGISGIATGYKDIDDITTGMKPGELIILAARPSMGKTSLALNIAEKVATVINEDKVARGVGVFSLEMTSKQLANRMLCSHSRVAQGKLHGESYLSREEHQKLVNAADALSQAPIYLDDTPALEVLEMVSRARRWKQQHDIQLIVVDYLQLLRYSEVARTQGRQLEVAAISGAMKALAKSLDIPVLVLSQLSRATETRDRHHRPQLSDLRDSGSIEQDADVVMFLRRPSRISGDEFEHDETLAILDVAKNRNGACREIHLHFTGECTRFDNRARDGVDADMMQPAGFGGYEEPIDHELEFDV